MLEERSCCLNTVVRSTYEATRMLLSSPRKRVVCLRGVVRPTALLAVNADPPTSEPASKSRLRDGVPFVEGVEGKKSDCTGGAPGID